MCCKTSLNDVEVSRFQQLMVDKNININCRKGISGIPILLLCRHNRSESLYPCLKSILERDDVDLDVTFESNNTIMLLCRYYPLSNRLLDCIRLLKKRGIDINLKDRYGKTALVILAEFVFGKAKSLKDIVVLLINEKSDLKCALEAVEILRSRCIRQEAEVLSTIIESYRLGGDQVKNQVRIYFLLN